MAWLARLRSLFQRRQLERDLEDELRDHLRQETESNIQAGMSPEEARFAAQRLLGPIALYKEECRDARAIGFLEISIRDLRYALRMLRRTPLFTAVALITLAIAIGANTAVFTFIDNVLVHSVPVQDPARLGALNWGKASNVSYLNYLDLKNRNTVFSELVAYHFGPVNIVARDSGNFRGWGYEVTGNYFRTLGIQPVLGRFFGPQDDDQPGAHPVVVISYNCWQARFGGHSEIVGNAIKINGFPFTIIGVAGRGFKGTELILEGEYWVPLSMIEQLEPGNDWTKWRTSQNAWIMGRLKHGVSIRQAEANLNQIASELAREYPADVSGKEKLTLARPGLTGSSMRKSISSFGYVVLGIAGLGLLLACVNLAGMLLARVSDRRREMGIRMAIGASRGQLLRQLMTESFLLAACGGLLGYGLAVGACRFLNSCHPNFDIPINIDLTPNVNVLCFTVAAALLTTLLCGLAPALQTIRVDLVPSLKNEPVSVRFQRLSARDLLVAGQIALSVVLVVCSVLVAKSLQHALSLQLGFTPSNAVSVSFDLGLKGYDQEHIRSFQNRLLRQMENVPGIEAAGVVNTVPLTLQGADSEFIWPAGQEIPKPADRKVAMYYNMSAGYLRAAGTRLLAGRDLDDRDSRNSPAVAIVNQEAGRELFGQANPLGQAIRVSGVEGAVEIVGMVEDGKYESLGEDPRPAVFVPITQQVNRWTTLVVRTHSPGNRVADKLRKIVLGLDSEITIFNAGSFQDHLAFPLLGARLAAVVLGTFGVFAMALAAIGLFALMSYAVSRRTREIGIRMALGARRGQVLSSLVAKTLVLCAIGIVAGVLATLAAGGFLSAVLYDVSPRDPASYALVLCVMVGVALAACWVPARRALNIDPMRALRED